MKKLLSMLKVIPDNVRVLHRNLVGAGWFADHEELGEIYGEIDGIADDVIEIAMSLGHAEPSLAEAVSEYQSIGGSAYENEQAWSMLHAMLLDLHEELGNQEGSVPGDVWNKLEEHQYYLNKLANYKVASRLNKRAVAKEPDAEVFSTDELKEAFTKAGFDTAKYTVDYLAEQMGFAPISEQAPKGALKRWSKHLKAEGVKGPEAEKKMNIKEAEAPAMEDREFGIPEEKKYPLYDKKHVESAAKLFGFVEPKHEEKLARAIVRQAEKLGVDLSFVQPDNRLFKHLPEKFKKKD